jgi:flagellar hook assembly protein FlgD
LASTFESDEFGEARLRVDGDLYGENGEIYLGHEDGGSGTVNTGWTSFVINLSSLPNTTHTIDFLGFNNKKTRSNEELTVGFDNITISGSQQSLALMKTSEGGSDSFETEVDYKNEIVGNYPNPFNPTTKILFTLEQDSDVKVIIYNILGREVIRLFDGFKQKGASNLEWLGVNSYGLPVATGTYILSIQTPHWSAAHKMKIVK